MSEAIQPGAAPMPLRVDLVSDVVCPWCIVGYKQFERALESRKHAIDLDLHWHAFELNPDMPEEGQDVREHLLEKYGPSAGNGSGVRTRLTELGAQLGFHFDYSDDMRIVNTFRAHQLLHWAEEMGKQTELKLALFAAYFSEGRDVNDPGVLLDVVEGVGLSPEEAESVLADGRFVLPVRQDERHWLQEGVQGVPCFVINEQYIVQGAQDSEAFGRMLDKLLANHQG